MKFGSVPAIVPAVLERPMKTPAWRGAMSMWFTLKPPRAKPAAPSARLVAATPPAALPAIGISNNAPAVPQNPVQSQIESLIMQLQILSPTHLDRMESLISASGGYR